MSAPVGTHRDRPHFVYRLLGRRGRVLYIGCTVNPQQRTSVWKRSHTIGPLIGRVELIGPLSFRAARRVEKALIEQQGPAFNVEHTPRHRRGWSTSRLVRLGRSA
jgi:hypothetical protein